MYKIGILGLGAKTTSFYIDQLNTQYNRLYGGDSTCPFLLLNTDFNKINANLPTNFNELQKEILPYLHYFEALKIERILIPNITLHQTIDILIANQGFSFNIIHPIKLAIDELIKLNIRSVTVLGSYYTMTNNYISNYLTTNDIIVNRLPVEDMLEVDIFRRKVFSSDEINIEKFEKILSKIQLTSTPLFACTELSILNNNQMNIDMTCLQINKALYYL